MTNMQRMFKRILIALLLCANCLHAQILPIRHYTDEDGLISNVIYNMERDHNGYLWLGSDKGISRFNGLDFKNFTTSDGLPDNEVFNLKEDGENRLWLCCFNGEMCYYKDGRFFTAANTPWLKLPFKSSILRNFRNEDGSINFIFADNSRFAHVKGNKMHVYQAPDASMLLGDGGVLLAVKKISDTRYKLFYRSGTIDIDTGGKTLDVHPYLNRQFHYITNFAKAPPDEYLLSDNGIYNLGQQLIFPLREKLNFDRSVCAKFTRHDYFVGQLNSVLINDSIRLHTTNHVSFIEKDFAGNIWCSTMGNGLFSLSKDFADQHHYPNAYKGAVLHGKVKNGNLLYATNSASLFQIKNHIIRTIYNNNDYTAADQNILTDANFLITDSMDYLVLDGKRALIIPTADRVKTSPRKFAMPIAGTIKEIFYDAGKIIVAKAYAMGSYDYALLNQSIAGETEIKIQKSAGDPRIYGRDVNPYSHTLWFYQDQKLYEIQGEQQTEQTAFRNTGIRQFEFLKGYIIGLNDENTLLIASSTDDHPIVEKIPGKAFVWSHIYQIDQTRAIISTNNYYRLLTLFPAAKGGRPRYTLHTIEDPFIPQRAEYVAGDDQTCFFFKNGHITEIATHLLSANSIPPQPVFSSLRIAGGNIPLAKEITLSYGQSKNINIGFDIIAFAGRDLQYQYAITSGNDSTKWMELSGREINLNNPGYGSFSIRVRARTLSSPYSTPAMITLQVQKPFWATWWFIALCILLLIAAVWGFVVLLTWRKLRKRQKEHDADMKYQQSEYKALNALMNPHFIFNSLNNIQGLINKDEKRTANQYLVIFSDLIRQNMHNISRGFISLREELTLVENYLNLEKLRFKEMINYEITVDEDTDIEDLMIPPLMIQPLVENAVKHGLLPRQSPSSKVSILVYEEEETVFIVIEDNGIGITESLKSQNKLHDSFGLANLKKRTEHLKKIQRHDMDIDLSETKNPDGTVSGTRAVVRIQFKDNPE